jgi:hypothetical protein
LTSETSGNDISVNYPYPSEGILKDLHREDLIKKLISESKSGMSNTNMSNTNLSYQQVLQMTNKTIPPIMQNLFNDSMTTQHNPYQMTYSYMPPYGYYAPPMPFQMPPYQVPYSPQMANMPMQTPQSDIQNAPQNSIPTTQVPPQHTNPTSDAQDCQKPTLMNITNSAPIQSQPSYPMYQQIPYYPNQVPNYPNQMPNYYYQYPPQMAYGMHPYPYQGKIVSYG